MTPTPEQIELISVERIREISLNTATILLLIQALETNQEFKKTLHDFIIKDVCPLTKDYLKLKLELTKHARELIRLSS